MEPIEFRDIDLILSLSEELNFTRAAEKNYISQPALSKIVRKVERNLGAPIFERTSPLKITPEGERFIEYFRLLRHTLRQLEEYCDCLRHNRKMDLAIGAPSYFCTYTLPQLLTEFESEHDDFNIKLIETNDAELRTLLSNGAVDVGFTVENHVLQGLNSFPIMNETIIQAVPRDYGVNSHLASFALSKETLRGGAVSDEVSAVSLSEFAGEKFLFLKRGNDSYSRGLKLCRDAGFEPHVVMELDQMLTAYRLAEAGLGIAFIRASLPCYAGFSPDLCLYKIAHTDTNRKIYVVYSSRISAPRKTLFIDYLYAHCPLQY